MDKSISCVKIRMLFNVQLCVTFLMGPNAEEEGQIEEGHHGLVGDLETKLQVPQPVHLLNEPATSLLIF
jgi:hypothetical protein